MSAPHLHRRGILAAALAGAVVRGAGVRAETIDPIHAAIAHHHEAEMAYCGVCSSTDRILAKQEGRRITQADYDRVDYFGDRAADALTALASTVPATLAGVQAMLAYMVSLDDDEELTQAVASALASPAFAGVAQPAD